MSKTEKPLSEATEKVKEELAEVPAKSGLAGTLLVILIITGVVGIAILAIVLLTRQ